MFIAIFERIHREKLHSILQLKLILWGARQISLFSQTLCYYRQNTFETSSSGTNIRVCHNKRIRRNKVFTGLAEVGKSTMGWFFGFKLHLLCNERGELVNFYLYKCTTGKLYITLLTEGYELRYMEEHTIKVKKTQEVKDTKKVIYFP
jgi:hypothetical protein